MSRRYRLAPGYGGPGTADVQSTRLPFFLPLAYLATSRTMPDLRDADRAARWHGIDVDLEVGTVSVARVVRSFAQLARLAELYPEQAQETLSLESLDTLAGAVRRTDPNDADDQVRARFWQVREEVATMLTDLAALRHEVGLPVVGRT